MNTNPIKESVPKTVKSYLRILRYYGEKAERVIKPVEKVNVFNEKQIREQLSALCDKLGDETRSFIVETIDGVISNTINLYNNLHKEAGYEPLKETQILNLRIRILKEFLLSKFIDRTLDDRVNTAVLRLKNNITPLIANYAMATTDGVKVSKAVGLYFSGTTPIAGGTSARWNTRLIVSEMLRAYQYTAIETFKALDIEEVKWNNTSNYSGSFLEEYAKQTYAPNKIPPYPYPCNDSFFTPVYKK